MNQIVEAEKLKRAFANGVPDMTSHRDVEAANRESDDAREAYAEASYKHGTKNVPRTGVALLHKGEAVIPAEKNPRNPDIDARGRRKDDPAWGYLSYDKGGTVEHTGPAIVHKGEEILYLFTAW